MNVTIEPENVAPLLIEVNLLRDIINEQKLSGEFPQFILLADTITRLNTIIE